MISEQRLLELENSVGSQPYVVVLELINEIRRLRPKFPPMSEIVCASRWLRINENEWEFGVPVRGVIREVLAEVYFDEDRNPGWVWFIHGVPRVQPRSESERGVCGTFLDAVEAAENALGIASRDA